MVKCPHCGSDTGVYTTFTGKQYYYWDGEPAGYYADVPENQRVFARCLECGKKISMRKILDSRGADHDE